MIGVAYYTLGKCRWEYQGIEQIVDSQLSLSFQKDPVPGDTMALIAFPFSSSLIKQLGLSYHRRLTVSNISPGSHHPFLKDAVITALAKTSRDIVHSIERCRGSHLKWRMQQFSKPRSRIRLPASFLHTFNSLHTTIYPYIMDIPSNSTILAGNIATLAGVFK